MRFVFGVDIGGTSIKIGVFDCDGTMLDSWSISTNTDDEGTHILPDIAGELHGFLEKRQLKDADVEGVGIGVPGPVDAKGTVMRCANLGWGIINVPEQLSGLTGYRVKAGNDANVAALGEVWQGSGQGRRDVVMVTLGTGVGGGIIVDGKIVTGAHGAGGEFSHMYIHREEQRRCGCGKINCLEMYASGRGIAITAANRLESYKGETPLRGYKAVTAKEIFGCAAGGDDFSLALVDEVGGILGEALAQIACVCDPEVFILGGGVSRAGKMLVDAVRVHYRKYVFHASADTDIVLAKLGSEAGMYGCARLIMN